MAGFNSLTNRERQVMVFAAKGYTTSETAKTLKVSAETVKSHRRNILAKTLADSMTEAVFTYSDELRTWSREQVGKRRLHA